MLNAKEVRLGNLIYGTDGSIKEVTIEAMVYLERYAGINQASGICLTEEWLLKFGFEKDENIGYDSYFYSKGIFYLFHEKDFNTGFVYPVLMKYGNHNEYKSGRGVTYVHELQNLYYAVEGRELKLLTDS